MTSETLPKTCLPDWSVADLPEPQPLAWRDWTRFIGPGVVMCGIQIGGGEWLLGPDVTAKYGGGLMWIATTAIVLQVFYNLECGRYALYCGEPIFTGFMRTRPGPRFWMAAIFLLNFSALVPGLSAHGAAIFAALVLDRPPGEGDRWLVTVLAYVFLAVVSLPVLAGGKVYNTLQAVMTTKFAVVLGFCLLMGVLFVSPANWLNVFSGFLKFGNVPVVAAEDLNGNGRPDDEVVVNLVAHRLEHGAWPVISLAQLVTIGAFAGYAGGGGMSNSTYGNFVRDKGWGMGSLVGAIPSAFGGRHISLSHLGTVFPLTAENLRRWRLWWRYVLTDQLFVWAPGCFVGMAMPALVSLQFAPYSTVTSGGSLQWAQALITADGLRHAPQFSPAAAKLLWLMALFVGLMVMLPSQMSIVDDFSRRWTDILWSGSSRIRASLRGNQVKRIYYTILGVYVVWSIALTYVFTEFYHPKAMTQFIANFNNLAIGATAFHLLWINTRLLPVPLRPRWYSRLGLAACGVFYLGLGALVFFTFFAR
jgi:hypothetical protein